MSAAENPQIFIDLLDSAFSPEQQQFYADSFAELAEPLPTDPRNTVITGEVPSQNQDPIREHYPHIAPGTELYSFAQVLEDTYQDRHELLSDISDMDELDLIEAHATIDILEAQHATFNKLYRELKAEFDFNRSKDARLVIIGLSGSNAHDAVTYNLEQKNISERMADEQHAMISHVIQLYKNEAELHFQLD